MITQKHSINVLNFQHDLCKKKKHKLLVTVCVRKVAVIEIKFIL